METLPDGRFRERARFWLSYPFSRSHFPRAMRDIQNLLPIVKYVLRITSCAMYQDDEKGSVEMFLVAEVYNLFIVATIASLFMCKE